ncbi:antibiotic biosynthesis monooxygenase family protein [Gloeobacter morelensis]|uniref:Antibiotic biosynthesis monooxygenase n=1 Tax=Gloeobacter morelensis MG652769 TaxID=2781736 RepID=A0ABY3PLH9_9CYAN|nr:hypothetical protein [Gloeobacter morelensis]UFP94546.1 hypothetical protein ISF26_22870 [Gloeobacter morelensis MG652769]
MPAIARSSGLPAEFAVFAVEPEQQSALVQSLIAHIESTAQPLPGFVSGTVHRSRDGLRVTGYIQWATPDTYVATPPLADFASPDAHLYEIFAEEPAGSQMQTFTGMEGLINFGIFKMKAPENQPRFVELFIQALGMVSGQTGLISTHAHRSLDGWRCINYGHWRSLEEYAAMDCNRPFSSIFAEMLSLADNEYQPTLHEVVFTTN